MAIPHYLFFIFNMLLFLLLFWKDKNHRKDYLLLSALGLVLAFIFENVTTYLGFWQYHSSPKVLFISLYTWLLYAPYLSFCYFIGNKLGTTNG
ncbi:MAG: hypothetical protein V1702_04860 [Candidatus Woesearchaeota archaeon]